MLAPLEWLFPGNWIAMKCLVLALFGAAMPIFYLLVRDQLGTRPALLATALCLTNSLLLEFACQVMSEIPYLLFSLLTLFLLQRSARSARIVGNYWFISGLACMMWAYFTRSVGVTLVAAALLYLLIHREHGKALVLGATAILTALPWALRNRALSGYHYLDSLFIKAPYHPEMGTLDLAGLLEWIEYMTRAYLTNVLPGTFWPSMEGRDNSLLDPVPLLLLGLATYAVVLCARRRQHLLLLIYAAFLTGTILVWPWWGGRFLVPLVPLVIFFAIRVAVDLLERLEHLRARPVGRALMVAAFLALLTANLSDLQRLNQVARGDYRPAWSNYFAAGQWLKARTPEDIVICCRKPHWMYIVSGRSCTNFPSASPEKVIEHLEKEGVAVVIVSQLGFSSTKRFLLPAIEKHKDRFEVLWHRPSPDTYVLRFIRET